MINQKRNKIPEDCDHPVVLSKKRVYIIALLLILLMAMLISLVSACGGQGNQPKTAKDWLELGEKHVLDLEHEQAIDAFKKVIEIEPDNVPARIGMAKAYVGLDKPDEAKAVLLEVLELDPSNKEATDMLASLPEEQDNLTKPSTSTDTLPSEITATDPQTKSLSDAEVAALIEQRVGKFEWYEFGINPLQQEPELWQYIDCALGYGYGHGVVSIEPITLKNNQKVYLVIAIHDYPTHNLQELNPAFEIDPLNDRGSLMNLTAYLFMETDGELVEIEQRRLINAIDSPQGSSLISTYEYEDQIWLAVTNWRSFFKYSFEMLINMKITESGFTDNYNVIVTHVDGDTKIQQAHFEDWSPAYDYYPVYHVYSDNADFEELLLKYLPEHPSGFEPSDRVDRNNIFGPLTLPGVEAQTICEIKYPDNSYHDVSEDPADYKEEITNYARFGY